MGKGCCMVNQKGLLCWSNVWAEKIKEDKMQGFLEKTGREDSNYKSAKWEHASSILKRVKHQVWSEKQVQGTWWVLRDTRGSDYVRT